jgi:hypothetical protein
LTTLEWPKGHLFFVKIKKASQAAFCRDAFDSE